MVSADVCKPNTQIPVEELLEALKMFKREEIEAEQTDDESVDRHGAGLLREYQVCLALLFRMAALPTSYLFPGCVMQLALASSRIHPNAEWACFLPPQQLSSTL